MSWWFTEILYCLWILIKSLGKRYRNTKKIRRWMEWMDGYGGEGRGWDGNKVTLVYIYALGWCSAFDVGMSEYWKIIFCILLTSQCMYVHWNYSIPVLWFEYRLWDATIVTGKMTCKSGLQLLHQITTIHGYPCLLVYRANKAYLPNNLLF